MKLITVENRKFKLCLDCSYQKKINRCREYKKRNKDYICEYNKNYKKENKDYTKEYNKNYNIQNRKQIQKRQTEHNKLRRKTDLSYKMSIVLRNRFRKFYKGLKIKSMLDIVGCSYKNYVKWIEFNFIKGMSWENHGSIWHIDHVLLCHLFDHNCNDDVKICFNWKNTRPLLVKENLSRKTINYKDLLNHEIKLTYFEKKNQYEYNHIDIDFIYLATKLSKKLNSGSS